MNPSDPLISLLSKDNLHVKRSLIVGNESLVLTSHAAGYETSYVLDEQFADHHDRGGTGFRARLAEMEANGIHVPGHAMQGFWSAIGGLSYNARKRAGVNAITWHHPTWHAVLSDTSDPWMHPSSWSRRAEDQGEAHLDIIQIARLVLPGGVFGFRNISAPNTDDGPDLWREDWVDFLKPYFDVTEIAVADESYLIAKRNEKLPARTGKGDLQSI